MTILVWITGGLFVVALVTEAFERGAGRRFPEWDGFLLSCCWIAAGMLLSVAAALGFFLALGRWG